MLENISEEMEDVIFPTDTSVSGGLMAWLIVGFIPHRAVEGSALRDNFSPCCCSLMLYVNIGVIAHYRHCSDE